MNKLTKDDPLYYKTRLNKLINQARNNGLELSISYNSISDIRINFEADNGDIASVHLLKVGD